MKHQWHVPYKIIHHKPNETWIRCFQYGYCEFIQQYWSEEEMIQVIDQFKNGVPIWKYYDHYADL